MSTTSIEPELKVLLSKLTVEIQSDSREIEILKKRIEKNEALLRAVRGSLGAIHPQSNSNGYGSKSNMIWDAIIRIPTNQFTQNDVEAQLRLLIPQSEINRNRIRAALWTFANKTKKLRIIRKGNNLEPAQYEKIQGVTRYKRLTEHDRQQTLANADAPHEISPALFENEVRSKSGRIEQLAQRLKTDEETLRSMTEPASKVYVAVGGWLRVRE